MLIRLITKSVQEKNFAVDESNLTCEDCGRSTMTRFGKGIPWNVCPSCQDEFDRLNEAGKLIVYERKL